MKFALHKCVIYSVPYSSFKCSVIHPEKKLCVRMCEQMCDAGCGCGWKGADLCSQHHLYLLSTGTGSGLWSRIWCWSSGPVVLVIYSVRLSNCDALLEPACTSSQELAKWPQLGGFRSARVGVLISQELVKYCKLGLSLPFSPSSSKQLIGKHLPAHRWISVFQMQRK